MSSTAIQSPYMNGLLPPYYINSMLILSTKKQDQDIKHFDDHRDDASERTTPGKVAKSPQKTTGKRSKLAPFKVTLLDTSEYESSIEVRAVGTFPRPHRRTLHHHPHHQHHNHAPGLDLVEQWPGHFWFRPGLCVVLYPGWLSSLSVLTMSQWVFTSRLRACH